MQTHLQKLLPRALAVLVLSSLSAGASISSFTKAGPLDSDPRSLTMTLLGDGKAEGHLMGANPWKTQGPSAS